MIIRQLKPYDFERLNKALMRKANAAPLDASYTVNIKINSEEYEVKIQPENHCKMAVLQALRIHRDEDGPNFTLITQGKLLASFLEILICQGVH